jgi:hypothetical protein
MELQLFKFWERCKKSARCSLTPIDEIKYQEKLTLPTLV